ncbi:MAG: CaiB/BaiF CoA transferase family protein [Acidimicrobiales bacterium]
MTAEPMLAGIRVLDMTQYLSGPSATQLLAGVGADVIKVEPGPRGDPTRTVPALRGDRSAFFVQQNRGKRSICIDFADPAGHGLVRDLIAACDVVVENFGPGVLEKRRLDYDSLRADQPDLIMASISAFGKDNSLSHLPGYDIVGQAYAGVMHLTGEPDGPPLPAGTPISDCAAGMMVFGAVGHALFHRSRTGEGQHIDVNLVEPVLHMQALAVQIPSALGADHLQVRRGQRYGTSPPSGSYKGPNGHIVIHLAEPQWPRFCDAVAGSGIDTDPRFADRAGRLANEAELADAVEAWMQTFPTDQALLEYLADHRCPAGPVVDVGTAAENYPWYRERGAITTVEDPELGTLDVPGFPARFGAQPEPAYHDFPAPGLGQHTDEVLAELLGYDDAEISRLRADAIVR